MCSPAKYGFPHKMKREDGEARTTRFAPKRNCCGSSRDRDATEGIEVGCFSSQIALYLICVAPGESLVLWHL